jgi:hypothetical protein
MEEVKREVVFLHIVNPVHDPSVLALPHQYNHIAERHTNAFYTLNPYSEAKSGKNQFSTQLMTICDQREVSRVKHQIKMARIKVKHIYVRTHLLAFRKILYARARTQLRKGILCIT